VEKEDKDGGGSSKEGLSNTSLKKKKKKMTNTEEAIRGVTWEKNAAGAQHSKNLRRMTKEVQHDWKEKAIPTTSPKNGTRQTKTVITRSAKYPCGALRA